MVSPLGGRQRDRSGVPQCPSRLIVQRLECQTRPRSKIDFAQSGIDLDRQSQAFGEWRGGLPRTFQRATVDCGDIRAFKPTGESVRLIPASLTDRDARHPPAQYPVQPVVSSVADQQDGRRQAVAFITKKAAASGAWHGLKLSLVPNRIPS